MFVMRKLVRNRQKKLIVILIILIFGTFVWYLRYVEGRASNELDLKHFRRNRNLSHYLSSIRLLAEPSFTPCESLAEVPLLVLVSSTPPRYRHRDAIRATWGPHLPTYFVLGLTAGDSDVINLDQEAKQYNDLIVYDLQEHYQNLTLKTALMLRWTRDRCPAIGYLMKTDDDILVNPWIMSDVLKENVNAQLIGFKSYNVRPLRDEYDKWYLPQWLFNEDFVPQYLLGGGYLINGKYISSILEAAIEVPLINLEDIYFTYLVAKCKLALNLTHDRRLSPYTHWFLLPCLYMPFAINHDLSPDDMMTLWPGLIDVTTDYKNDIDVCSFYKFFYR